MRKNKISPFTEDWLPIKDIQNGMILTTDKYLVTGVKITPSSFNRFLSSFSVIRNAPFIMI